MSKGSDENSDDVSDSGDKYDESESKHPDDSDSTPKKPDKGIKRASDSQEADEKENVRDSERSAHNSKKINSIDVMKVQQNSEKVPVPSEQKPPEDPVDIEYDKNRVFNLNEDNEGFPTNYISTTKYNLITFFPFCLLKQFARIANVYFLIIAILASIPSISSIDPYTAIFPLIFVLLVSIFREGVEDFYRYKSDKASNSKKVSRLGYEGTFEEVTSKDLEVGDIVYVEGEDTFAADIVLLKSSNGVNAFIQTSSLDGEKNLKKRFVPKGIEMLTKPDKEIEYNLGGQWTTLPPDKDLKSFAGSLLVGDQSFSLSIQQLLLKDSKLKNTSWIIGTVAYTGKQTKVMMNSQKARIKVSNLEKKLNVLIIVLFLIQIVICFLLSMATLIYDSVKDDNQSSYIGTSYNTTKDLNFFSYFLLLSTLIPISLIVTLEVIKVVQCYFISQDSLMFEEEAGRGTKVSSTTINEELGQVTYVFSDKTGTLTQNIMEFKALAVGEEIYGDIGDTIMRKPTKIEQRIEVETNYNNAQLSKLLSKKSNKDDTPHEIISSNGKSKIVLKTEKHKVQEVLKLLGICHDCERETAKVGDELISFYQGESPDEITLVDFAKLQGFEFLEANEARSKLLLHSRSGMIDSGQKEIAKEYKIHRKVLFNSERKRMSILFTDPDDNTIKLYIKGADSIIKDRLSSRFIDEKTMDCTNDFLARSSVIGLRTLLMAMRVIDKQEFDDIMDKIHRAESDVGNAAKKLEAIFDEFERELVLIGATWVEDKLQDKVPETLNDMRKAGVKVWMLTGDKLETAKNIGYSCRLLTDDMVIFQAQGSKEAEKLFTEELVRNNQNMMEELRKRAVVFDAEALTFLTKTPQSLKHFITVAKTCNSVILSRASPSQKADIVRMIKKDDPTNITLSIGDGANDVAMILEADIGIGIYGKEGVRAAQSADFAIYQFKFLWNLVLYHGRFNYIRNSELILYFFYKNVVFTVPQIYFAYISDFSGQTVFDDWYISFYNMFFTSLPIIMRSIFEKDVDYRSHKNEKKDFLEELTPELYYIGRRGLTFTYFNYFIWMVYAMFHSLWIFLITYFVFKNTIMDEDGKNADLWSFSICVFFSIMIVITIKIMITGRLFNVFNLVWIFLLSLLLYYSYNWASNYLYFSKTYLTNEQLHSSPVFYLTVFLCSGSVFVLEMLIQTVAVNLLGDPIELLRKITNTYRTYPDWFLGEFNRLMLRKEKKFVHEDIRKEKSWKAKRETRMKRLQEKLDKEKQGQLAKEPISKAPRKEVNEEVKTSNGPSAAKMPLGSRREPENYKNSKEDYKDKDNSDNDINDSEGEEEESDEEDDS